MMTTAVNVGQRIASSLSVQLNPGHHPKLVGQCLKSGFIPYPTVYMTLLQQTRWWTPSWPTLWCCPRGTSWTDPSSCATCSTPPPIHSTGSRSQRACWSQVTLRHRPLIIIYKASVPGRRGRKWFSCQEVRGWRLVLVSRKVISTTSVKWNHCLLDC